MGEISTTAMPRAAAASRNSWLKRWMRARMGVPSYWMPFARMSEKSGVVTTMTRSGGTSLKTVSRMVAMFAA